MATANIKISQLPNIGSNLNSNTLLPVVSTNGTFLTDKVTVGNLANFILDEAGNLLNDAFVAQIAYGVANANQPNITSVGNLTSLSISNVQTLHIPGGTNGYFLQTDGNSNLNWSAPPGAGNGSPGGANAQIQFNNNGLFGGNGSLTWNQTNQSLNTNNVFANNITLTNTVTALNADITGNLSVNTFTSIGNINANYFIGNGSQLTGVTSTSVPSGPDKSIQFNNSGTTAGNSNLTFDVATSTLNIIQMNVATGGNIYEDGNALIVRTEPTHIFEIWGNDGATDYKWSFDQDGHLTLPGNGYIRGDANLIQMYNNANSISGISLFDDFELSAKNSVQLFTNNDSIPFIWTFDPTGNLIFPDGSKIFNGGFYGNNTAVLANNSGDVQAYAQSSGFGIQTYDGANYFTWTYFNDGNLQVPGNITPDANITYDLGNNTNRFKDIYLANSTIYLGDATLSANGNSIVVDSITVTNGNVGTIGNIASLNLDGSNSNVLYGNGVFAPGGGGNANLGDFTFANTTMSTPNEDIMLIQTTDNNGNLRTQMRFDPDSGIARMIARNAEQNSTYTTWTSATYTGTEINVVDAPDLINFLNNGAFSYGTNKTFSVNGGNRLPYDGYSAGGNNATIYTSVAADPDPTTVTSMEFFWQLESKFEIDYDDGAMNINSTGMSIYIDNDQTQGPDIWLRSGDDITIQGKDKTLGSESEGGDINIYAGDGAGDDGVGNNSSSGGDIQIYAGVGGYGNSSSGSQGGFARMRAGTGGDAGVSSVAGQGGFIEISAGAGGYNNGNIELGALGGHVDIYAGQTTLANTVGGNVSIRSGEGGDSAIAGNVQIITPASGPGVGGTWTFDGNGNLTLAGGNSVIFSTANSSLDPLIPNVSTMTLTPDANYNSQVLVLDPTAPGHIHLRAHAFSNIDDPAANIFLGGEQTAFEITQGANNVARIHSGNLTWTFSNNSGASVIDLPGESVLSSNNDTITIQSYDTANSIGRGIYIGTNGALYFWDGNSQSVSLQQDNTNANLTATGNASITSNSYTWTFDSSGNLTTPGNIITSGSGGDITLTGGNIAGALRVITTPTALTSLTAVAGGRAFVNDSNLVAAGNFGAVVGNGGSNTVPVWSDGTNWYIG